MKLKPIYLLLALCLLLCGCAGEEPPSAPVAADFSAAGMHITLPDTFTEKQHVSYTALYESADLALMVLKEEYTLFDNTDFSSQTPVEQYGQLVWSANELAGDVPLQEDGDLVWFEFDRTANGTDFRYRVYLFKSNDAFWMFQFAARTEGFAALSDTIGGYAASIYFDEPYLSTLPEVIY